MMPFSQTVVAATAASAPIDDWSAEAALMRLCTACWSMQRAQRELDGRAAALTQHFAPPSASSTSSATPVTSTSRDSKEPVVALEDMLRDLLKGLPFVEKSAAEAPKEKTDASAETKDAEPTKFPLIHVLNE